MAGAGKDREKYIPHCRNSFKRSLTYCGIQQMTLFNISFM